MKFVAIALFACIAAAVAGPVSISDNNVGNIVTVGLNANAVLSNQVDQTIVNVIAALLNQQGLVVAPSAGVSSLKATAEDSATVPEVPETPQIPQITPEMFEKFKSLFNKN
jgi:hypothetical protein